MNSKGLAMALAGAGIGAALCASAMAQSSVTLYGIVDAGFTYTSNQKGSAAYQATGGNEQGTRWGMVGTEDLGGGNTAIFKLENGFNIETGTASANGRMFGRQAWVGLSNPRWGTFTMGRQYNAAQDSLAPLQIGASTSLTQYALHPFDTDDLNNSFRTDNSVKYVTPTLAGFQGNAMYGFSNSTNFAANRSWSVGGTYAQGPLRAGVAYVVLDNPALDTTGAIPSDNYFTFLKGITKQQIWGAASTYDYGNATFGLLYTSTLFNLQTGASQRFNNYEGSFRYRFTPSVLFALGETYTQVHTTQGATPSLHYLQTSAGVQYYLSKRTDLYVNAIYQRSSANTVAAIEGISNPSSSRTQVVGVVGIRQKF
ncbi:porin [Paraburkholderia bryophila]|uniref:Putative porin n=1 Tax=Paraburkholderia bryophila TaxID=420952 RepID=A0A329BAV3_9BURK|nr:porin [Paraburkholderia bryophila]RAS19588.1 putative porin [Paraburkholderia bryophila]